MPDKVTANFHRKEFACKCGCGLDAVDVELVRVLENLRMKFQSENIGDNVYVEITSGNRCGDHNARIGGSDKSQHTQCKAADIKVWRGWHCLQISPDDVAGYLERTYGDQYGVGRYDTWTHIDVRRSMARWDNRTKSRTNNKRG